MSTADDDALLSQLRRTAADADPVPETVLAAARAAIETRHLEARLARLVADSAMAGEDAALGTVRGNAPGTAAERMLLYENDEIEIDVAVREESGSLTVMGTVVGADGDTCVVERADGRGHPLELDALGRFVLTGLSGGPLRLRCRSGSGSPVVTEWVNL
jgi:hypothetical protein